MTINTNAYGTLNKKHVTRIKDTFDNALEVYSRVLLLRVDLRMPDIDSSMYSDDASVITRFISSLKSKIEADLIRRQKAGKRIYTCNLITVWCREFGKHDKKHYHVALWLNKDVYAYPGSYKSVDGKYNHNLAYMIMSAWVSALNIQDPANPSQHYFPLVHFPKNCYYHINKNSPNFDEELNKAIERVKYLAKDYSKDNSDGKRNFGCSNKKVN